MSMFRWLSRASGMLTVGVLLATAPAPLRAQGYDEEVMSGAAAAVWPKWKAAMEASNNRGNRDAAETAFEALMAEKPSAFRVALMADRSIMRNEAGGGVGMLEQDAQAGSLKEHGKALAGLLETGREQMNEADDGWFFAASGQFAVAAANFDALAAQNPDPVALLEFADRVPRRREVLVLLADNPIMAESVRKMLVLLQEGERKIKADPIRIRSNIERLGGPPRMFENAVARLKDSGESAIPFMVEALRDPNQRSLTPAIVRTLPLIDRGGLNPLVMATRIGDRTTRVYVIRALGQIPYAQSVPYLKQLREAKDTSPDVLAAVDASLQDLSKHGLQVNLDPTAHEAFYRLAKAYYERNRSVAADPRQEVANVWYWRDDLLQNVEVPSAIFNEIMAMRCCEEALRLNPDFKPALALWLAANIRREAQLPEGGKDFTRPENYPSAAYFAQSAGPEYCLMALTRATEMNEPAVALGLIDAIQKTGGPASVVGDAAGMQPLAQALSFPDRLTRIRAAIALGTAMPSRPFQNSQNFMAVMGEALSLHAGSANALVVDGEQESLNEITAGLRAAGYSVVSDASLSGGLEKLRAVATTADAIVIASDIASPGLAQALSTLRGEFRFAATPVLVLVKPGNRDEAGRVAAGDHRTATVPVGVSPEDLARSIRSVSKSVGATQITPEVGAALALEAAGVLRNVAMMDNPVMRVEQAEKPLIGALGSSDAALREIVAQVLGYIGTEAAQSAIAKVALNAGEAEPMRVSMFKALADAGKRRGNKLPADLVDELTKVAEADANLAIRTAASQSLGALTLPGNPASAIIRNQYGG